MAWADDIALLNLRIARQQRYVDWLEGVNSNVFGPRGENADWSNSCLLYTSDAADE